MIAFGVLFILISFCACCVFTREAKSCYSDWFDAWQNELEGRPLHWPRRRLVGGHRVLDCPSEAQIRRMTTAEEAQCSAIRHADLIEKHLQEVGRERREGRRVGVEIV